MLCRIPERCDLTLQRHNGPSFIWKRQQILYDTIQHSLYYWFMLAPEYWRSFFSITYLLGGLTDSSLLTSPLSLNQSSGWSRSGWFFLCSSSSLVWSSKSDSSSEELLLLLWEWQPVKDNTLSNTKQQVYVNYKWAKTVLLERIVRWDYKCGHVNSRFSPTCGPPFITCSLMG